MLHTLAEGVPLEIESMWGPRETLSEVVTPRDFKQETTSRIES